MPTAPYYVGEGKDKKRVPGVTTVLSRFKESGGLMHWAWDLGMQGINYRDVRDKAASTGSICHDMIEEFIHGRSEVEAESYVSAPPEDQKRAGQGFDAFHEWWNDSKIELLDTEMHIVSEEFRFGGTPDAVGRDSQGRFVLLDWKTSNNTYLEYIIQLAAYDHLVTLKYEQPARTHLLRVGKDFADFHHHSWPRDVIDRAFSSFRQMRWLYDELAVLKKLV